MKILIAILSLAAAGIGFGQTLIFVRAVSPSAGIPAYAGDSTTPEFPADQGWFAVRDAGLAFENPTTISATGAGAGKSQGLPATFTKFPNAASASLFAACANGGHWDTLEIVFARYNASTTKVETFLKAELKLVFVTGVGVAGSTGDDNSVETVKIVYGAQRYTFYKQNTGTPPTQVGQAVWSFVKNQAVFDN